MKLTAKVKLEPTQEQRKTLLATLKTANRACNYVSKQAWEHKKFGRVPLHNLTYYDVREQFDLTAQMAVRCIGKVRDAYAIDKRRKRTFKLTAAFPYDDRILSWKIAEQVVSIWTLDGRQKVPFVCGQRQRELLQTRHGESDLAFVDGNFYLLAACDVDEPEPIDVEGYLGIDKGLSNIAVDSDGESFSGSHIKRVRHRRQSLRSKLQAKGTRSAKRKLKRLAGKESRFATDTNHVISKKLVEKAQRTKRGIALEDLSGIRSRVRARRTQRYQLHSWAFYQLDQFVSYKAALAGIPVEFVDPAYTSQECAECGNIDKRNRPDQSTFLCTVCGHAAHADTNAATVISRRAAINQPNGRKTSVADELSKAESSQLRHRLSSATK